MRRVLASILSSGNENAILIFSVQKSPDGRVPIAVARFGLEIQLAVEIASGSFMARTDVVQRLVSNKQDLIDLGELIVGSSFPCPYMSSSSCFI